MANLDFRKDLVLGNQGEVVIKGFLEAMGCVFIQFNNDNQYDLKMLKKGVETTYEIKTDVLCKPISDTGNMFIEFKCRDKPSGIETSKAEWFVTYFKFLNQAWFIKSDVLKVLINENDFRVIVNGGDVGSKTHGYLINRDKFIDNFIVVDIYQ
jgi:hypothetical protein